MSRLKAIENPIFLCCKGRRPHQSTTDRRRILLALSSAKRDQHDYISLLEHMCSIPCGRTSPETPTAGMEEDGSNCYSCTAARNDVFHLVWTQLMNDAPAVAFSGHWALTHRKTCERVRAFPNQRKLKAGVLLLSKKILLGTTGNEIKYYVIYIENTITIIYILIT